jgi:hypothetical protein
MPMTDTLPPSLEAFQEELRGAVKRDLRRQPRRRAVRVSAAVACVGAAAAGLMVASPWKGGPSIVERAAAAIAPRDDAVIHRRIESITRSPDGAVTRRMAYESWEYGAGDERRFRTAYRVAGARLEHGGTPTTSGRRYFELLNLDTGVGIRETLSGDLQSLTESIRENLENGDWRVVGEAVVDGRPVTQLGARDQYGNTGTEDCSEDQLFIDRATYEPVLDRALRCTGSRVVTRETRFRVIDVLPATPENIALTSVAAQHPDLVLRDKKTVKPSDWPDAGERNQG